MALNINYKNSISKHNSSNHLLFVDENFNILSLKKYVLINQYSYISDLIKTANKKKKFLSFDINSKKK